MPRQVPSTPTDATRSTGSLAQKAPRPCRTSFLPTSRPTISITRFSIMQTPMMPGMVPDGGIPHGTVALITIDVHAGQSFHLVESDGTLAGRTAIILSADHGGTGTGHSTATAATNYTIPFFAWGAGVGHGDFYSINSATRLNPGTARPDYNAIGQPIRNGDGGNLAALSLLGLGPIPGSMINVAQDLRVAVPEPSTLVMLVLAAAGVCSRRRRAA